MCLRGGRDLGVGAWGREVSTRLRQEPASNIAATTAGRIRERARQRKNLLASLFIARWKGQRWIMGNMLSIWDAFNNKHPQADGHTQLSYIHRFPVCFKFSVENSMLSSIQIRRLCPVTTCWVSRAVPQQPHAQKSKTKGLLESFHFGRFSRKLVRVVWDRFAATRQGHNQ